MKWNIPLNVRISIRFAEEGGLWRNIHLENLLLTAKVQGRTLTEESMK